MKVLVVRQKRGDSPARRLPKPGQPTPSMAQVAFGMGQSAWLLVEPVFDADSAIRRGLSENVLLGRMWVCLLLRQCLWLAPSW
jgi:hypothetical protein